MVSRAHTDNPAADFVFILALAGFGTGAGLLKVFLLTVLLWTMIGVAILSQFYALGGKKQYGVKRHILLLARSLLRGPYANIGITK